MQSMYKLNTSLVGRFKTSNGDKPINLLHNASITSKKISSAVLATGGVPFTPPPVPIFLLHSLKFCLFLPLFHLQTLTSLTDQYN